MYKLQLRRLVFANINLGLVVARTEMQLLLCAENIILLLLLIHLLDVNLHLLIWFNGLTDLNLALKLRRSFFFC